MTSSITSMRIATLSFSHCGGRGYNEDALAECEVSGSVRFLMLADGAGGQGGGDVASATAIAAARAAIHEQPGFSSDTLLYCMKKADEAIQARQKSEPALSHMASTFVGLLLSCERSEALMGNLGDSRCYILRGEKIIAQSYDHSMVQRFVDAGLYPLEKLREHPRRNVLCAALGANPEQIVPYTTPQPIVLQPGDGALLCSDGVWELLDEATLIHLHQTSGTLEIWRDRLYTKVRSCMSEGHDNFSAILVKVLRPEDNPGQPVA